MAASNAREMYNELKNLESEESFIRSRIIQLYDAFQARYPSGSHVVKGWSLVLEKCSERRKCQKCPHNIYWRRFTFNKQIIWLSGPGMIKKTKGIPSDLEYRGSMFTEDAKRYDEVRCILVDRLKAVVKAQKSIRTTLQNIQRKVINRNEIQSMISELRPGSKS